MEDYMKKMKKMKEMEKSKGMKKKKGMMDKYMKKDKSEGYDKGSEAKMKALHELRDMARGAMKDNYDGMSKVTVAAKDQKGLSKGLDKAKKMMKKYEEEEEY